MRTVINIKSRQTPFRDIASLALLVVLLGAGPLASEIPTTLLMEF